MSKKSILLQRAEEQFLRKDYSNALKIYSLILNDYPKHKEAKVGAYLSDMGLEADDDAQALFDYYQAIKKSNTDADKIISDLMQALYSTRVIIQQAFGGSQNDPMLEGGISYADFTQLVEERGSFKAAFEDIMFSTKVVISTKEDFIDFLTRLIGAGYYHMVLGYLDTLSGNPVYDQDIYELYKLIPKDY
jgi:hypothetical protein